MELMRLKWNTLWRGLVCFSPEDSYYVRSRYFTTFVDWTRWKETGEKTVAHRQTQVPGLDLEQHTRLGMEWVNLAHTLLSCVFFVFLFVCLFVFLADALSPAPFSMLFPKSKLNLSPGWLYELLNQSLRITLTSSSPVAYYGQRDVFEHVNWTKWKSQKDKGCMSPYCQTQKQKVERWLPGVESKGRWVAVHWV